MYMHPRVKVSDSFTSSFILYRQKDRQDFCLEVFSLKEKLQVPIEVDMGGVKALICNYYDLDDVIKVLCKPFYYRLAVNPHIHRAIKAILLLSILFSITPSGLFVLVAFNVMGLACLTAIGVGIGVFSLLLMGSLMDGLNFANKGKNA